MTVNSNPNLKTQNILFIGHHTELRHQLLLCLFPRRRGGVRAKAPHASHHLYYFPSNCGWDPGGDTVREIHDPSQLQRLAKEGHRRRQVT